ncbi:sce7726 family protein [Pedobacter sp.]
MNEFHGKFVIIARPLVSMDYNLLARSYHTLAYPVRLREILQACNRNEDFSVLSKFQLHQRVNEILYKKYHGEETLKYKLAQCFLKKDYVAAFEVKVKSSRADFLVINGDSKCFEIKSKLDTLSRLGKQSGDYKDVFEYNTVVVDKRHLKLVEKLLPDYYGIWGFAGAKKVIYRQATLSPFLDPSAQLQLFTKKELIHSFGASKVAEILDIYTPAKINGCLKETLKRRYDERWSFVKSNWEQILPVDLQFFFNRNICPQLIYNT